jgi:hypothetical protein
MVHRRDKESCPGVFVRFRAPLHCTAAGLPPEVVNIIVQRLTKPDQNTRLLCAHNVHIHHASARIVLEAATCVKTFEPVPELHLPVSAAVW